MQLTPEALIITAFTADPIKAKAEKCHKRVFDPVGETGIYQDVPGGMLVVGRADSSWYILVFVFPFWSLLFSQITVKMPKGNARTFPAAKCTQWLMVHILGPSLVQRASTKKAFDQRLNVNQGLDPILLLEQRIVIASFRQTLTVLRNEHGPLSLRKLQPGHFQNIHDIDSEVQVVWKIMT